MKCTRCVFIKTMSVLIGLVDQRIQESVNVGWDTNKIGGLPAWIVSKSGLPASIPQCKNCGQPSSLITQIYCPLGGSAYHRCVYLFACPGVCSKQQTGWRVFRSMLHDDSYQTDIDEVKKASQQSSKCVNDLWTQEQDDWGEESADWGEDTQDPQDLGKAPGHVQTIQESSSKLTSESDTVMGIAANSVTAPEVLDYVTDSGVYTRALPQDVESLFQLKLSDGTKQCDDSQTQDQGSVLAASGAVSSQSCGAGEEPLEAEAIELADAERWNAMAKLLNTKLDQDLGPARSESRCPVVFESYYLSVVDEPPDHPKDCDHVTDLIRHYERSEGKQIHLLVSDRSSNSKGKEGPSEVYEKTELKHGDKIFYKFMKRLQRCPQQCIRYERGGNPLLVSSLPKHTDLCSHCGGERVFEFQLLPSLIPFLKAKDGTPCEVEFGTVLVFTCERNCWPADHDPTCKLDLIEESIILQEDPDFHLYR